MFKKLFSRILIAFLLITPICLLVGCDLIDFVNDINEISEGGGNGEDSLGISEDKAVENLKNLGLEDGYEITYEYENNTDSGRYIVGRKGNTIWIKTCDNLDGNYNDGYALVRDGDKFYTYTYNEEEGYVFQYTYEDEETASSLEEVYAIGYNYWLYFGYTYDGLYKKDGVSTVAGRKCDKYVYELSLSLADYKMKYVVYVDQELGITLKLEVEAYSEGEQEKLNFETKKFNVGSKVEVPLLPNPIIETEGEE